MSRTPEKGTPARKEPAPSPTPSPFDQMRRNMDEMMGRMFREWPSLDLFEMPPAAGGARSPSMDVAADDDGYEITVDLPGMDEKDILLSVDGDLLTISAEHEEAKEERRKTYHVSERRRGTFRRCVRLPRDVDPAGIEASFRKGVLTVDLPRSRDRSQAKTIEIKTS